MTDTIFLGYVNSFEFKTPDMADRLSGHPIPGRVYRIIQSEDGVYRVHIGRENNPSRLDGIILGEELQGSFFDKWKFEITVVNRDNLLDFTLDPEDLAKISGWLDTDNSDLKELLKKDLTPVPFETIDPNTPKVLTETELHEFIKKISSHEEIPLVGGDEEKDLLTDIGNNLNFLIDNDLELLRAINDALRHVVSCYGDKYEKGDLNNLSKQILLSQHLGKGANIYTTMKYLQRYGTSGFEKSDNIIDIYKAIHFLLFEIQRTNIQNDKNQQ